MVDEISILDFMSAGCLKIKKKPYCANAVRFGRSGGEKRRAFTTK
jgi:hypothetical protein